MPRTPTSVPTLQRQDGISQPSNLPSKQLRLLPLLMRNPSKPRPEEQEAPHHGDPQPPNPTRHEIGNLLKPIRRMRSPVPPQPNSNQPQRHQQAAGQRQPLLHQPLRLGSPHTRPRPHPRPGLPRHRPSSPGLRSTHPPPSNPGPPAPRKTSDGRRPTTTDPPPPARPRAATPNRRPTHRTSHTTCRPTTGPLSRVPRRCRRASANQPDQTVSGSGIENRRPTRQPQRPDLTPSGRDGSLRASTATRDPGLGDHKTNRRPTAVGWGPSEPRPAGGAEFGFDFVVRETRRSRQPHPTNQESNQTTTRTFSSP